MTERFSKSLAPNKRAICAEDKATLTSKSGKCVILPGGIGSKDNPLEYEELLLAGFDKSDIYCFESSTYLRDQIKHAYGCNVYSDIEKWINRNLIKPKSISYFHLDLNHSITQHIYSKSKYFSHVLEDESRFRITTSLNWGRGGPYGNYQTTCARNLAYLVFLPACVENNINEFKLNKVSKIIQEHLEPPDEKLSPIRHPVGDHANIGQAMFMYAAFGLRGARNPLYRVTIAEAKVHSKNIKNVRYKLTLGRKYLYSDAQEHITTKMLTTWFDVSRKAITYREFLNDICDFIINPGTQYDFN